MSHWIETLMQFITCNTPLRDYFHLQGLNRTILKSTLITHNNLFTEAKPPSNLFLVSLPTCSKFLKWTSCRQPCLLLSLHLFVYRLRQSLPRDIGLKPTLPCLSLFKIVKKTQWQIVKKTQWQILMVVRHWCLCQTHPLRTTATALFLLHEALQALHLKTSQIQQLRQTQRLHRLLRRRTRPRLNPLQTPRQLHPRIPVVVLRTLLAQQLVMNLSCK